MAYIHLISISQIFIRLNKTIIVPRPRKLFNLETTLETVQSKLLILQTENWKETVVNYLI